MVNATKKSVKKTEKKTSSNKSKKNSRKLEASKLLKSLPQGVENIKIVQQVACVLEELQNRVIDVREEASKELKKLMKRYESNYKGIEKRVHEVTFEAKKQAQTSIIHILQKWHEHKEKLPKPLTKEIEKIVEHVGNKIIAKSPTEKEVKKNKTQPKSQKNRTPIKKSSGSRKKVAATKPSGQANVKNSKKLSMGQQSL